MPEISKAGPVTDYNGTREDVQEVIDAGREETQNNNAEVRETLDKAEQTINDLMDNSVKIVDVLIDTVTEGGNLSAQDKKDLRDQANELKQC